MVHKHDWAECQRREFRIGVNVGILEDTIVGETYFTFV